MKESPMPPDPAKLAEEFNSLLSRLNTEFAAWVEQQNTEPCASREEPLRREALDFVAATRNYSTSLRNSWRDYAASALAENMRRPWEQIIALAEAGDAQAIQILLSKTTEVCRKLSGWRKKFPEALKPATRKSLVYPVLISDLIHLDDTQKPVGAAHRRILAEMEVGMDQPIHGQRTNLSDPLTGLTHELLDEILRFRDSTPRWLYVIRKSTFRPWEQAAMELPKLTPDGAVVRTWGKVLSLCLRSRFRTLDELLKTWGHLITAPSKRRKGTGTRFHWLATQITRRLMSIVGMHRKP